MKIRALVLAAGQGVRMRSDLPKVLHSLLGHPMLWYAVQAARQASGERPLVVIGHAADQVRQALGDQVEFVLQEEQLGTGHAVLQAEGLLRDQADMLLVTLGDMPLLTAETLRLIVEAQQANPGPISMLTVELPDAHGFGRILRDANGHIRAIVEDAHVTPEQKQIKEVNPSVYCFDGRWLWDALRRIPISPKGEYYLTDLVGVKDSPTEELPPDYVPLVEKTGEKQDDYVEFILNGMGKTYWAIEADLESVRAAHAVEARDPLGSRGVARGHAHAEAVGDRPVEGLAISGNVGRAFRAPTLFELFTNGPHLGEDRYEIGLPDAHPELSFNADLSVRWQVGRWSGQVAGYRNQIDNYLYVQPTNTQVTVVTEEGDTASLPLYRFVQTARAVLWGMDVAGQMEALPFLIRDTPARVVVLDEPNLLHLAYHYGVNPVRSVVKGGHEVFRAGNVLQST